MPKEREKEERKGYSEYFSTEYTLGDDVVLDSLHSSPLEIED
jgi:hypothetical protein